MRILSDWNVYPSPVDKNRIDRKREKNVYVNSDMNRVISLFSVKRVGGCRVFFFLIISM